MLLSIVVVCCVFARLLIAVDAVSASVVAVAIAVAIAVVAVVVAVGVVGSVASVG